MKALSSVMLTLLCGALSACGGGDGGGNVQDPLEDQGAPFNSEPAAVGGDDANRRADFGSPETTNVASCSAECGEQCGSQCQAACLICGDRRVGQCISGGGPRGEQEENDFCGNKLAECVIQFACISPDDVEADAFEDN
jgi:hypothetical protein